MGKRITARSDHAISGLYCVTKCRFASITL
jgi:hypothetical protein